mmetsp:Transcript_6355/g.10781  ORF Transcript_6355/g.10781 Transcript_6355/m.10781 type:complete len:182 (+) Transcript_6355:2097-2642(+)
MASSESKEESSDEEMKQRLEQRSRSNTGQSFKKLQTFNRRATVFGDNLEEDENSLKPKVYKKSRKDLKRLQQLQVMEFKTVGKSRLYELVAETSQNVLIRFLIHFLFVNHDSRAIDLFDSSDQIFSYARHHQQETQSRANLSFGGRGAASGMKEQHWLSPLSVDPSQVSSSYRKGMGNGLM